MGAGRPYLESELGPSELQQQPRYYNAYRATLYARPSIAYTDLQSDVEAAET